MRKRLTTVNTEGAEEFTEKEKRVEPRIARMGTDKRELDFKSQISDLKNGGGYHGGTREEEMRDCPQITQLKAGAEGWKRGGDLVLNLWESVWMKVFFGLFFVAS